VKARARERERERDGERYIVNKGKEGNG